jgi:hypothetical protein
MRSLPPVGMTNDLISRGSGDGRQEKSVLMGYFPPGPASILSHDLVISIYASQGFTARRYQPGSETLTI